MIILRVAQREEIGAAMQLINQAKEYLKSQGIDQWQNGYPDPKCIQEDIEKQRGYFLVKDKDILGYLCIDFDGEPAYETINGNWKSNEAYGVVHRLAVSNQYRGMGIADVTFRLVQELCDHKGIHSMRVDTDADNRKMQHILQKNGFEYCGTIQYDNSPKIAFEKKQDGPPNTPPLETARLILRKFTKQDIDALLSIHREIEVNTFLPWFPLKSVEEAKTFFEERYAQEYKKPLGYKYAICLKTDNVPIGYVSISMEESHDLGYGVRKEFWHKGIVTEASRAVVEQVKKDGLLYITATHDINNPRSGSVMQQLGMDYKYSYEEQWQPKDMLVTFRMYQLNLDGEHERVYTKYRDA